MAIIEFENGIRVEVEGKPTPEDVEEIWQQVKDRKPPQQPKQPEKKGFLSRVKEDIVERGKQFGESIERQIVNSKFSSSFGNISYCSNSILMSENSQLALLLCPTSVTVHDDGYVLG